MFERLTTPAEAYGFKLGAALTMERTILDILDSSIEAAQDPKVAEVFRTHRTESEEHVTNLEEVFRLFDWEVDTAPCPAIDGLQAEATANTKKTDNSLVDSVLLQGAVEIEHHEIGVYENLILNARAMGREDVVDVLCRNLESEQHALSVVTSTSEEVASVTPKDPPEPDSVLNRMKNAFGSGSSA